MEKEKTIKNKIISRVGGVCAVAKICNVTPGAVSQWYMIPAHHQQALVNATKGKRGAIKPQDFFETV